MQKVISVGNKEHGSVVIGPQRNKSEREALIDAYEKKFAEDGWTLGIVTFNMDRTQYDLYFTRPLV